MQQCFLNHIMENIICKAVKDKNTNPGALTTLSKIGSTTWDVKAIKYCHNLSNITKIVLSITITIRGWSKWSLEYDTTIQAKNDTTIALSLIPVFQTILKTGRKRSHIVCLFVLRQEEHFHTAPSLFVKRRETSDPYYIPAVWSTCTKLCANVDTVLSHLSQMS